MTCCFSIYYCYYFLICKPRGVLNTSPFSPSRNEQESNSHGCGNCFCFFVVGFFVRHIEINKSQILFLVCGLLYKTPSRLAAQMAFLQYLGDSVPSVSHSLLLQNHCRTVSLAVIQRKRIQRLFNPRFSATMFSPLKVLQQNGSCCISNPQITESRKHLKTSWHSDPWVSQRFSKGLACTLVHWNNAKWCGYEGNVCQNCWVHFNYREGLCNPPDWPDIIQK